ncbi:MAG: hypothetical protein KME13_11415 [Myxacorys californica WJT36-NPBG1]|jgi:hypothetical protein|nr:hypothetical protein [Myxacorys californica WJT36-NPBG1]
MPKTYDAIVAFYGKAWKTLPLFNLAMVCGNVSTSIATGSPIELSHFDGYMNRKKQIQPDDRLDAANALCELSQALLDRAENMPQDQLAELDRQQKMIHGAMND